MKRILRPVKDLQKKNADTPLTVEGSEMLMETIVWLAVLALCLWS